jgi:TRAP-type C4-dicarboxylate transport system substrate-binding protein
MVNKMRIGQIHAAGLSGAGLSGIERGVMALQIPMMFDSYEELDYVRERVTPHLERLIESRGYVVLNWGDVGWVHFFTTRPANRLGDIRKMKLFTWAGGDNGEFELWKANGFQAVPLAATDILRGLPTGLIEAVPTTPLYALLDQSFGIARNMIDVKWAPLIGATVITRHLWDSLPATQRTEMMKAAREAARSGGRRNRTAPTRATTARSDWPRATQTHSDARLRYSSGLDCAGHHRPRSQGTPAHTARRSDPESQTSRRSHAPDAALARRRDYGAGRPCSAI